MQEYQKAPEVPARSAPLGELVDNVRRLTGDLCSEVMEFQRVVFGVDSAPDGAVVPDPIAGLSGQLVSAGRDLEAIKRVISAMREKL